MSDKKPSGMTFQNNAPVGSAGQPQSNFKPGKGKNDARAGAVQRRIERMNSKKGKTN